MQVLGPKVGVPLQVPPIFVPRHQRHLFHNIDGRKGVFFCKDFYGAPQTGDHVDLWNGWCLTAFRSVISIYTSFGSQYTRGRIWFWEVA